MTDAISPIAPPNQNGAAPAPFLTHPRPRRRALHWLLLILILWLATFLRVWQLDTLPPGLHYDEAFNGTMARDVLRGNNRPIFFTPNFGEEPLHIYTEALLFAFIGESGWTIRLVSAVFGILFVAALYACARAFFPQSDWLALIAAFIAATLYWAINFSRIGIETNGLPMLITLSATALVYAYKKMTWRWVIGAGFLMSATLYTYLASRLWLPAVFLWFLYLVLVHRSHVRAHFPKWFVMGLVAILTLAPLLVFFVANPTALNGRAGTVFTPEFIILNLQRVVRGFFWLGDSDPRDNLIGRPALDIILAPLFVIGFILSLTRYRKPLYAFLLIWFGVMLLPTLLSELAPNFRRAIGALPAIILFCALGLEWLATKLLSLKFARAHPIFKPITVALLSLALVVSAYWSAYAYFVTWASGTGLFYSFDAGLLHVARALAARPAGEPIYITPAYAEHYTMIWALNGRPVSAFDGRFILVLPDSSRAATYGIIVHEDPLTQAALNQSFAHPQVLEEYSDAAGKPYSSLLHLPPNSRIQNATPAFSPIQVGDFATLINAKAASPHVRGDSILIETQWQVIRPAPKNYTVSVQLHGPTNPADGSNVWAQQDKQPGSGTYPTTQWQPGQTIFDKFVLKIPDNAPAGAYSVQVVMYLLETGERVTLTTADSTAIADNLLTIHTFTLESK